MSIFEKIPAWRQLRNLSTAQWLSIALVINLVISAYILSRMNSVDAVAVQAAVESTEIPTTSTTDLAALAGQLQQMQSRLQVASIQLTQKGSSLGLDPSVSSEKIRSNDANLSTLWTEIDQLNQIMQPLMIQLEEATATQSSRSPSEIIALRTRVNTIHQRLAYLLAQVEAMQARPTSGTVSSGLPQESVLSPVSNNPYAPEYQQLYQNMVQMQMMLQQIQQGITP